MAYALAFQPALVHSQHCEACRKLYQRRPSSLRTTLARTPQRERRAQPLAAQPDIQDVQEASTPQTKVDRNGGELFSWQQIDDQASPELLKDYQLLTHSPLEGQPRTAPTRVLPAEESTSTDKPVLFYRDTNAWCPFCERVSA